jgi:hypothetical protein
LEYSQLVVARCDHQINEVNVVSLLAISRQQILLVHLAELQHQI